MNWSRRTIGSRRMKPVHNYERLDKPRGEFFHTNWTRRGGNISSSTYNV